METILWQDRQRNCLGLPWTFTKFRLTEHRFFISKGLFNVREDEVRLYRIMDISLQRSFGQRLFGLGTIKCCSSDKNLKDFEIKNIKDSEKVKELLSELIEAERDRKKVSTREFMNHEDDLFDDDFDDDHVN